MKKVISLALFKPTVCLEVPKFDYVRFTKMSLVIHKLVFKGYDVNLYTDYSDIVFENANVFILKSPRTLAIGQLWRLKPIWDKENNYVFIRDVDAVPMSLDFRACEEFINSGFAIHTESFTSVHGIPFLGGLSGFKCSSIRTLYKTWEHFISGLSIGKEKGLDQEYLKTRIWDKLQDKALTHRIEGVPNFGEKERRYLPTIELETCTQFDKFSPFPGTPEVDLNLIEKEMENINDCSL